MEPKAAVLIPDHVASSQNDVFLESIIIDDETTTIDQLQNKKNGGCLIDEVMPPNKRGDVGHRVRSLGRQCEELATMTMTKSHVNNSISSGFAVTKVKTHLLMKHPEYNLYVSNTTLGSTMTAQQNSLLLRQWQQMSHTHQKPPYLHPKHHCNINKMLSVLLVFRQQ
eukprot:12970187-Ditylum_brightwellii.AAC.1